MTQYPEGMLARELGICYVNIALITDYDAGLEDDPSIEPVSHEAVLKVFEENNHKLKGLIYKMVSAIPLERAGTAVADVLKTARG